MLKLREIRVRKGFKQKEIADILGITQASASRIELGYRNLNQNQIIDLALALEVTPGELLGFEEAYNKYKNYLMELVEEKEHH